MYYKKLQSNETVIEFHNNWAGLETVTANGQTVSQKSSVWGTNHYFNVVEGRRRVRFILTTKVNGLGQVLLDLRRNGQLVYKNVLLQKNSRKPRFNQPTRPRQGRQRPQKTYIPRENKAKKSGILKLKEYQLEEALEDFQKALKQSPKDAEIYFHLACIYSVLERTTDGFEAIKQAKALGFQDDEAILTHDMLAYLRLNDAFEAFVESKFTEYNKAQVEGKLDNDTALTAHSEYGRIETVFIKKVDDAFLDKYTIESNWKDLNYLGKPDFDRAKIEYQNFQQLLQTQGTNVQLLPADFTVGMDSMYCRDASISTNAGMILCNMGKGQRAEEPTASKAAFEAANIKILGQINAPGTVEGGDVAWLDEKTLAVAHGYRTNDEGFNQLKALLEPIGVSLLQVALPHYKGPSDVFHLMSIFSPVDKNLAVVYSTLMPVKFRNELLQRGYELVEVPDEEFESMGCNVLAIAPRKCIMVEGNPITQGRLVAAGCEVVAYEGTEISIKGGGGPTCLTRPIFRYREG
ncbi:MAG: arginine deiminase family protein [Bacteroidota bacterium]